MGTFYVPKHKDYPSAKNRRERNGNEVKINIPKASDARPVNEKHLLSPCGIAFNFLN